MNLTDYLEEQLLQAICENGSFAVATCYLALYEDATADDGSGTEVTGGSYARQAISWATVSGDSVASDAAVTFTNLPATTATHAAIWDHPSAGNMLLHGELSGGGVTFVAGQNFTIDAGDIVVSLD